MCQSWDRAVAAGLSEYDLNTLGAIHVATVGRSKVTDQITRPALATLVGRWKRPAPDDTRTQETITKARDKVGDTLAASLRRLADVGSIIYEPGRGGRYSVITLSPVEDEDADDEKPDDTLNPPTPTGVDGEDEERSTPVAKSLNPRRESSQPPSRIVSTPPAQGGTTDRTDGTDRYQSGPIGPDAHASTRQRKSADRAAELLTSLAPVADDDDEAADTRRQVALVVDLIAMFDLEPGLLGEALATLPPGDRRPPFGILAHFAKWLTDQELDENSRAAGDALRTIASTMVYSDSRERVLAIARATARKTRRAVTEHITESANVVAHWHEENYPDDAIERALARITRPGAGLRHPGKADEAAQRELDGEVRERYVPSTSDRGTTKRTA